MYSPIIAFLVTLVGLVLLLNTRLATIIMDQPNKRSLHQVAVPRSGGLAIMSGVLISWLWLDTFGWLILLLLLLIAISLIDDVRGVSIKWRFVFQILICLAYLMLNKPPISLWGYPVIVLVLVWMINLYNFMDGSDGLAGGMALFGFSAYGVAAYLSSDLSLALMSISIVAAVLAFLFFNFHPARIFMGDAGSVPLGFLAGAMGLYGWQHSLWPIWFPLIVFSPFIIDATVTLLKRLMRRERVWEAHRSHYYQHLVQMGWGHRKTAIAEYVLMLFAGASALLILNSSNSLVSMYLIFWFFLYLILIWQIDKRWTKLKALDNTF